MTNPLKDKVVIVTGASSGIGAACARLLAQQGCKLTLAAPSGDKLEALAEYRLGAGRGADPMIYLTIGTGIGGGAILGGELYTGTALGLLARQKLLETDEPSTLRGRVGVDGQAVGEAGLAGDALAVAVARQAGQWLGLGLVNLLHLFNPAAIVLGGSAAKLGDLLLEPAHGVMRDYFADLPHELREAALVDGASEFTTFWRIALPLAKPALVASTLICFAFSWNEFLFASVLANRDWKPYPMLVAGSDTVRGIDFGFVTTRMLIAVTVPVILSLMVQRFIVRGLTFGAVKG